MTKPKPGPEPETSATADEPSPGDFARTARAHLARAAGIMDGVAKAAEAEDGYLPAHLMEGMFRQAEIHALIGGGYANLALAEPAFVSTDSPYEGI